MARESPRVDGLCVSGCIEVLPCRRVAPAAPSVIAQLLHEASVGVAVGRDGTKGSLVSKNNYVYDFSSLSACKSTHYFVNTKTFSEKSDHKEPSPLILDGVQLLLANVWRIHDNTVVLSSLFIDAILWSAKIRIIYEIAQNPSCFLYII